MSTNPPTWKYLVRKPGSAYRQLFVRDRWIRARTLYGKYARDDEPMTPEEVAADYNLPLEVVLEAIAYCETNPPEIHEDWLREEALEEAAGMKDPEYVRTGKRRVLTSDELTRINRLTPDELARFDRP
jgi:uncharacterized protein (DUF433 family)